VEAVAATFETCRGRRRHEYSTCAPSIGSSSTYLLHGPLGWDRSAGLFTRLTAQDTMLAGKPSACLLKIRQENRTSDLVAIV